MSSINSNYLILPQNYYQNLQIPCAPVLRGGVESNPLPARATQPSQLSYPPDKVEFSATNKIKKPKDKMSTGTKSLLWGAGLTTLVGLGLWFTTKGKVKPKPLTEAQTKKLEELVSNGKIDKEYAEIFKNMNGLKFEDRVFNTYTDLAEQMGYRFRSDRPNLKFSTKYSSGGKASTDEITIFMQADSKVSDIFKTMRHELEHFRQDDLVYRSFGEEEYINAQILPMLKRLEVNEAMCIKATGKKYSELTNADIESYKANARKTIKKRCSKLRSLLERKGKIDINSKEYKEAELYLNAMKEYETIFMYDENLTAEAIQKLKQTNPERVSLLQEALKRYENNPLEVGANREGKKFGDMYKLFYEEVIEKTGAKWD